MAQTATLKQLTDRALDYADMTGSEFPDPDRLIDYVNDGLAELHDILVNSFEDYFLERHTFTIAAGQEEYDLPADFYKLKKLWYVTSGRRFKIERFVLDQIDGYRQTPITGGTCELWYVPEFTPLQLPNEKVSIAVPVSWEDYAALYAAQRLLMREESDTAVVSMELEKTRQKIINNATPRDAGEAESIGEFYGRWEYARHLLRFDERYFKYRLMGNKLRIIEIEYLGI